MTQFQGIDVDALFPYKVDGRASYRKNQKEAIMKALESLYEQEYNVFFGDCPVGFGKSGFIVTVLRVAAEMGENSYLTTPQLVLQDQYFTEFKDIPQIKGRGNYLCPDDPSPGVTAATGECQVDDNYKCEFRLDGTCPYITQRDKCIESSICGMNTSYMMTVRRELFDQRGVFACDESHSVPEWANGFVSVVIREEDVGFIPVFDKGFPAYLIWLEQMVYPKMKEIVTKLKDRVKQFGKGKGNKKAVLGIMEAYKSALSMVKKIEVLSKDYATNEEEWIFNIVEDTQGKKIVFTPITSGRFLNKILWNRGEKVILSSGTINPEIFIKEGGLQDREFNEKDCVISVPSEFDPKKSPIIYKSIGKMTNDLKPITFPKIMKEINSVINERKDKKGIIHTFSYDNADYIVKNIDPGLRDLLVVQERRNRAGSLDAWIKDNRPSVFVSTNMTEGLNLKGDLCRYQIFAKIGFPNTQDKRVAKRLELNHWAWYYNQAIEDIEQASGRATRSVDDWSEMFIFDSSFATLFTKYNKLLKPWFKDRLKFINV